MAKKTVKKAVAKKAPAKKVVKPAVAAPVAAPAVAAAPACGCGCGCKCGGFGRFVKKLVVFLVIFALGFAAAKFCPHMGKRFHKGPEFVNGCMDVTKIKCPVMLEKIQTLDADANGCITREEFRAGKKEMHGGCKGDCGCKAEKVEVAK